MIPFDFSRTVYTEHAPDGSIPTMVDMPMTQPFGDHRIRFEAWKAGGLIFVIVHGVDDVHGLVECAEQIDAWVRKIWGAHAHVIEDWAGESPRYRVQGDDGERVAADVDDLEEFGLMLTRDPSGDLITSHA
ncbi:hypothetical protein [Microbacterium istanbulense]|uniref:Uncharacterized protein n=1 Tax=Microbacterium istanbulense TaxID=3122049 RepID=A0ABU8LJ12_9MICO